MEFLVLAVTCFLFFMWGAISGWKAREEYAKKITEKLLENLGESVQKQAEDLIQITIEQHAGMFYVYNKQDNTFMAQGKTKEELEDALGSRFPGKRFAASQEELEKAGLIS